MEEAVLDAALTMFSDQQDAGDEKMHARFYMKPKLNRLKSEGGEIPLRSRQDAIIGKLLQDAEQTGVKVDILDTRDGLFAKVTGAGRPIYDLVEYVEARAPGDKLLERNQPATDRDRQRFPKQYMAFKSTQGPQINGTPLSKWPLIEAHQVEELKFFNIHTIEQLATIPDGNIPNVGNISHLKKRAADFLALAKGIQPQVQMRTEIESLKAMVAQQAAMLEQLKTQGVSMTPVPVAAAPDVSQDLQELAQLRAAATKKSKTKKEASNGEV